MHPAVHLVATREMDFLLTWAAAGDYVSLTLFEPDGRIYDNLGLFVRGGDIDENGLASCLRLSNAHHFTLANVTLHNGRRVGLEVSRGEKGYLYELVANNAVLTSIGGCARLNGMTKLKQAACSVVDPGYGHVKKGCPVGRTERAACPVRS